MGIRRLLDKALEKIDEHGERSHQAQLAKLTPAERERYEFWERRGEASRNGVPAEQLGDPRLTGTVLQGPAGEVVHGVVKAPKQAVLDDPAAWERQMLAELAAREQMRAPYLAPGRPRAQIMRVGTRPGSRWPTSPSSSGGAAWRRGRTSSTAPTACRPDQPGPPGRGAAGRVGRRPRGRRAAPAGAAAGAPRSRARRLGAARARRAGPLDEDVVLDILARANVGPERTLGIARDLAIEKRGGGDGRQPPPDRRVRQRRASARRAGRRVGAAAAGAPWPLAEGPPAGVVVDVLQWDAIARAVHPVRQHRARLPSLFPYLPLLPQELLRAYLEIVGVAAPTPTPLRSRTTAASTSTAARARSGHVRRTGGGPAMPCADGKARERMAGGHHIVIAYRDRPEYAEGRARFDAYAEQELRAFLRRGLGLRAPVPKPPGRLERTVERVADVAEFVTMDPSTDDTPADRARYTAVVQA